MSYDNENPIESNESSESEAAPTAPASPPQPPQEVSAPMTEQEPMVISPQEPPMAAPYIASPIETPHQPPTGRFEAVVIPPSPVITPMEAPMITPLSEESVPPPTVTVTPPPSGVPYEITPQRSSEQAQGYAPVSQTQYLPKEYTLYGYQQPTQRSDVPVAPPRKRSKSGVAFGMLLGAAMSLILVLVILLIVGGEQLFSSSSLKLEWPAVESAPYGGQLPPVSATPQPVATPRPSGGGDATLDIFTPAAPTVNGALTNAAIIKKGLPSVVCILVESKTSGYSGSGSGIIMTEENGYTYIITNCHVVRGYETITVVLHNDQEYDASIMGLDQLSDLAVIKIKATGLVSAEFGDSDALQIGDPVVVIGNPLGLELKGTATQGMISAINRDIKIDGRVMTTLQTDASVNHGNSGGPMFNQFGQVVGIISSKIMGDFSSSVEGLGFAIPIAIAKPVIDDLISLGYVSGRPTIGITSYAVITSSEARFFDLPRGVRVLGISENCDAYKQGLRVDDIIVEVDGQTITDGEKLNLIKNQHSVGETLTIKAYRASKLLEFTFILHEEGDLQ